jgi:LemA protein
MPFIILGIIIVVILLFWLSIKTQNRLAPLREQINVAAANIKPCRKKRDSVVTEILKTATSYAAHEKGLHERVSADFNSASGASRRSIVSHLINTFPELKADQTYMKAMQDLDRLESELQQKVEQHNAGVQMYNSLLASFPHDLFGPFRGFGRAVPLDTADNPSEGVGSRKPAEIDRPKELFTKGPKVYPKAEMVFRNEIMHQQPVGRIYKVDDKYVYVKYSPPPRTDCEPVHDIAEWMMGIGEGYYVLLSS